MSKFSAAAGKQAKESAAGEFSRRYSGVSSRNPPAQKRWTFGFRYFNQIENFGLDATIIKNNWLISVIDRFSELGGQGVDDIIGDQNVAEANRCHIVNWQQKNIPIEPEDLDWVPVEFRATAEFPLIQFAVSKAMGRVLGFFDPDWIFQVVLLDPLHNAQPSKKNEYKVRLCRPLQCDLTVLRKKVDDAIATAEPCECGVAERLADALTQPSFGTATVFCISRDDLPELVDDLIKDKLATSIQDIIAVGAETLLLRKGKSEGDTATTAQG